jgi:hypothetical protein
MVHRTNTFIGSHRWEHYIVSAVNYTFTTTYNIGAQMTLKTPKSALKCSKSTPEALTNSEHGYQLQKYFLAPPSPERIFLWTLGAGYQITLGSKIKIQNWYDFLILSDLHQGKQQEVSASHKNS